MRTTLRTLCLASPFLVACASVIGVSEPTLDNKVFATDEADGSAAPADSAPRPPECKPNDDRCPVGKYCLVTGECTVGCKGAVDCTNANAKFCNSATHQCVQCAGDMGCTAPEKCSPAGSCAAACSDTMPCNARKSCCMGLCIDTTTDVLNCGKCGQACSTDHGTPSCGSSTCTTSCVVGWQHCGTENTGCNTPLDVSHCGSCTLDCTMKVIHATPLCKTNTCDYTTCDQYALDNDNDRTNGCETPCGDTGDKCCPGQVCKDSADQCDRGRCARSN